MHPSLYMQDAENVKEVIQAVSTGQPCFVIKGIKLEAIEDALLIMEKDAVTKLHGSLRFILGSFYTYIYTGSFYTFNMHYTKGCKNFYSFFETVFCTKKASKKTKLAAILAQLTCTY